MKTWKKRIEAECKRMENKIPYWTEDGIYQQDYSRKRYLLVDKWFLERNSLAALSRNTKGAVSEYSQKK